MRKPTGEAGFTLLEVMISLVILTFISIGLYQATLETYRVRDIIQAEGEFFNGIRLAMDIVGRDIASIYNPALLKPPEKKSSVPADPNAPPGAPPQLSQTEQQELLDLASSDAGRSSDFWLPATEVTGIRPSRFVGTDNKMSFVSLSHVRIYRDAPESIFAKITYELVKDEEPVRDPQGNLVDAKMLVRTVSTHAFDDDERRDRPFRHRYPLIHGIKTLKYRYWRKDVDAQGRWESAWDNEKEDQKEKYPDLVEVTLEVVGPQKMVFDGLYKFRPEVPLRGLDPSL